jgi:hypothetical protein
MTLNHIDKGLAVKKTFHWSIQEQIINVLPWRIKQWIANFKQKS